MTDQFYVFLQKDQASNWVVELRNKQEFEADLQQAAAEFSNKLIDFRLREIVNAETLGVREALVKKAFMEGVPKPGLDGAISNEIHLDFGTHK